MPILGQDDVCETLREGVGQRHDSVVVGDRQRAAGQEVILQVDDEEDVVIGESGEYLTILAAEPAGLDNGNPAQSADVARFSGQIDAVIRAASGQGEFAWCLSGSPTRR